MAIYWTYEYSPYRSQSGKEIPAFEIFDQEQNTILNTNENLPLVQQENIARLAALAPELAAAAEKVIRSYGTEHLTSAIRELAALLNHSMELPDEML